MNKVTMEQRHWTVVFLWYQNYIVHYPLIFQLRFQVQSCPLPLMLEIQKYVSIMTTYHRKSRVEPTSEMLCISNTHQTMDNGQHNCGVINQWLLGLQSFRESLYFCHWSSSRILFWKDGHGSSSSSGEVSLKCFKR
jgi:hypothetical protein